MELMGEIRSMADIQKLALAGFTNWQQYGDVTVKALDDLLIFNYNTLATYAGRWNFFERVSRGLIINFKTGEIVARPFDKFFGWLQRGEKAGGHIVAVTEKMDGSLGVLFRHNGQYRIATRGSFDSEQARWATEFLNSYFDLTGLPDELTLLFEIIYPANRIVVDYGGREDLVLLAARNRHTGAYLAFFPDVYQLGQQYGFTLPKVYQFNDVVQILEQTGVLDAQNEGFVVEFSDGSRFKFKGDRYLELHRLITTLSFNNTLKALANNALNYLLETVPDEFLGQVRAWISEIQTQVNTTLGEVEAAFAAAPKDNRKAFALWVQATHPDLSRYLFKKFDGDEIVPLIYQYTDWGHRAETARDEDG